MYDNLKSLGITNPDEIDRYSLRQEANNDILKIYFHKDKGEFFAKSVKFKYPRQRKTVVADGIGQGYKEVQYNSLMIAKYLHGEIAKMTPFVNYSEDVVNPLFIWYMKPEYAKDAKWTLYDLQDKLAQSGWMVPAYTLPSKLEDYVVMRIVVRQGFSRDMADMLLGDIKNAITELEKLEYPTTTRIAQDKNLPVATKVFNHTGKPQATKK